jgi:hypothetical protein
VGLKLGASCAFENQDIPATFVLSILSQVLNGQNSVDSLSDFSSLQDSLNSLVCLSFRCRYNCSFFSYVPGCMNLTFLAVLNIVFAMCLTFLLLRFLLHILLCCVTEEVEVNIFINLGQTDRQNCLWDPLTSYPFYMGAPYPRKGAKLISPPSIVRSIWCFVSLPSVLLHVIILRLVGCLFHCLPSGLSL